MTSLVRPGSPASTLRSVICQHRLMSRVRRDESPDIGLRSEMPSQQLVLRMERAERAERTQVEDVVAELEDELGEGRQPREGVEAGELSAAADVEGGQA